MASNSASELASDEGNYIKCSACKEQDKNTAADKYCVDCQDYYCSECLKLHETLPALKSHTLLDTNDDKIGQLKMIPTEKCEKHNYKTVDMFCQNHDEVGCATCMATDHRNCKDVFYIPEMIKTGENKECQESIAALGKQFNELLDRFNKEDSDLAANKQTEIDKINSYAKEIVNKIKQAAEDASSQVEKRYQKLKSSLKENTVEIREKFDDFEVIKECIGATKQNISQAFVSFKLNKGKIAASKQACEKFSHIELGQRVQFTLDPNYEILIGNLIILGNVRIQPYSFVHKGSFDVRLPSDKCDLDIYGSCILSNGSIVFADNINMNIKLVDGKSLQVVDQHKFQTSSTDVCSLDTNEIAVCLPNEKKVSVFIVNDKFSPKFDISVNFNCTGIFYHDNCLYISDGKCVRLVDFTGKVLNLIAEQRAKDLNISNLKDIIVSDKSKNILACDKANDGKGVICLNKDGEILNRVSDEIVYPHGLTDAGHGKVFACGFWSSNVILLNERGEFEKVIMTDLSRPQALCFDMKIGRLYVPNYQKDKVEIYETE